MYEGPCLGLGITIPVLQSSQATGGTVRDTVKKWHLSYDLKNKKSCNAEGSWKWDSDHSCYFTLKS